MLKVFREVAQGKHIFMRNSSTSKVLGSGKIYIRLSFGKTLNMNNVVYVPSLYRNFISRALLNKAGIKLVFEVDRLVMSHNGEFIGKGYLQEGLFVLKNVDFCHTIGDFIRKPLDIIDFTPNMKKDVFSAYINVFVNL